MCSDSKPENLQENSVTLSARTGTEINYYFICHRKLWLFAHQITMEQESDRVALGRLVHEESYSRDRKEIEIDGHIKLDFLRNHNVVHEVKLSDKMEASHRWQLLYYLYYLKRKGIVDIVGEIDYPKLKQKTPVELTAELEQELEILLSKIDQVIIQPIPPVMEYMKICRTCSYAELCWG
ncbi:MAG: CRISPR-associated protein Cas4 [Acidobacteriota bacterium]